MRHQQIIRIGGYHLYYSLNGFDCISAIPAFAETAMWGFTPSRNLVSDEKNLPVEMGCRNRIKHQMDGNPGFTDLCGSPPHRRQSLCRNE